MKPKLVRTKAGEITPKRAWVIFHNEYMYGPCYSIIKVIFIFITQYKNDTHLIG